MSLKNFVLFTLFIGTAEGIKLQSSSNNGAENIMDNYADILYTPESFNESDPSNSKTLRRGKKKLLL